MDSWLKMVLLCGLLLIASLQTTNALRFRRSTTEKPNLETHVRHLLDRYKTHSEHVTKSVFAPHLDQLKSKTSCTCQSMMLERMLNIYEDIFQDMMKAGQKDTKNNDVKSLQYLMDEVKKLSDKYSEEQKFLKVWIKLQDFHSNKVRDGTQEGALNDFLMVFKQAQKEKQHEKHHEKVQ